MDDSLRQAIKEAYVSHNSDVIVYDTIEIDHPAFTSAIYFVRGRKAITATLETSEEVTFVPFNFDLVRPEVSPGGSPQCTIEIDNINRAIFTAVSDASRSTSPITITYRMYLSSDLSWPQNDPPIVLSAKSARADLRKVTLTAGYKDLVNAKFPKGTYTTDRFPGLIAQ